MKKNFWVVMVLFCILATGSSLIYAAGVPGESPSRVPDARVSAFHESLSPYGVWLWHDTHGWVWSPNHLPADWQPQPGGYWTLVDDTWKWVSDWPWTEICFHYGRWFYEEPAGWLWYPDTTWIPWRLDGPGGPDTPGADEDVSLSLAKAKATCSGTPPLGVFYTNKHFDLAPTCSGDWCFKVDPSQDWTYYTWIRYLVTYKNTTKAYEEFQKPYGQSLGIPRVWLPNTNDGKLYLLRDYITQTGSVHQIAQYRLTSSGGVSGPYALPQRNSSNNSTIGFLYSSDGTQFYLHTPVGVNRTVDHSVYCTSSLAVLCAYGSEINEMVQRRARIVANRKVQIITWDNTVYAEGSY